MIRSKIAVVFLVLVLQIWAGTAGAQLLIPASTQFDITGFLQEATVDPTCATNPHCGGTLKVNGHVVTVPRETIVIFPANALTWQELFAKAPAPWGIPGASYPGGGVAYNGTAVGPTSGMAMADCAISPAATGCTAPPLTTWEVHVVGNRVITGTSDQYIAGLVYVSQQGLNSGAGFINFIDYTLGEMRVGGIINDPNCAQGGTFATNPLCSGARVRINDPVGRYGMSTTSPDVRFTVDPDNPTIMAGTGYPMCLPRTAPTGLTDSASDPLCPQPNRPSDGAGGYLASITTNNLTNPNFPIVTAFPNSTFQAPFEVGDYITFAGTLVKDCPSTGCVSPDGPTAGPMPAGGTAATYLSAHTIVNNVAIYTWPGSNPAYIMTEVTIIGTGGLTVFGAGEAAIRTRFEGMMTDPSRSVHLYGIDLAPLTGATSDRDWGTIGVDPGPPLGAVKGRWRFRPPCAPFGTNPATIKFDKQCIMNAAGTFLPPTREMRSVIEGLQGQNPSNPTAITSANGVFYGQYHAPILEYIFPENVPGTPIVENNFNALPFLAQGGYSSSGIPGGAGTLVGQLNPWPSSVTPVPACTPATANAGGPYTVGSAGTVILTGSASGTAPSFLWAVPAQGTLSALNIANPVYTAPAVPTQTTVALSLTATNACGTSTSSTSVTINAPAAPTVSYAPEGPILNAISGSPVTVTATGIDPGGLPVSVRWTQENIGAPGVPTVLATPLVCGPTAGTTTCPLTFTVTLPLGAGPVTIQIAAEAFNSLGLTSGKDFTSVVNNPLADSVVITSAEYRISKIRLILTATSSVVSPLVNLFLNPYVTTAGTTYNPDPAAGGVGNLFTSNGGGLYTIDLVGAPEPAIPPASPLTVRSSLGGVSAPSALTRIRQ